ncbi:hypothetical protein SEUBUCD646_0B00680 [Saccharomyces eubayanus]|uniref:Transcriptional regulatory protein tod6 n=1 Tax=Saccharomyces pastorianus TaxID=27292 RepID=A0A6C1E428_SACPS|nr:Transcriptional regulatory protein tod6 [Saccharomyces pastorianus]CAI1841215.1 hypothetical protein SEUBUCD646_0B00680 [Saccharomyces eubayanus]
MTLPKLSSVSVSSGHVSASSHGFSILSKHPHPNNLIHSHSLSHPNAKSHLSTVNTCNKENGTNSDEAESLKKNNPSSWDPNDDIKLRHLKEIKNLGWKEIAHHFPNRTPNACQFRWRRLKSGNLKSNKTAVIDINKLFGVYTTSVAAVAAGATATAAAAAAPAEEALKEEAIEDEDITSGSSAIDDFPPDFKPIVKAKYMDRKLVAQKSASPFLDHESQPVKPRELFIKPRSFSHSMTTNTPNVKATQQPNPNTYNTPSTKPNRNVNFNDYENIGLVPKIIIRSRRNSFIPSTQIPHPTTKSRKSSHSVISSRRSSFNMMHSRRSSFNSHAPTEPISRRPSLVVSPYMTPRRLSTSQSIQHHPQQQQYHLNPITSPNCKIDQSTDKITHTRTFLDMQKFANKHPWSREDDEVLLNNTIDKKNHLSTLEISIVLPNNRSELEIQQRIDYLQRRGHTSGIHRTQGNSDDEEEDIDPLHKEVDANETTQRTYQYNGLEPGNGNSKARILSSLSNGNDVRKEQDELPGINSIFKNIF